MSDAPEEKPAEKNSASGKPAGGLLPMLIAIVLAPVLSWAVGKFLLVPQIETQVKAQFAASLEQAGKVSKVIPNRPQLLTHLRKVPHPVEGMEVSRPRPRGRSSRI